MSASKANHDTRQSAVSAFVGEFVLSEDINSLASKRSSWSGKASLGNRQSAMRSRALSDGNKSRLKTSHVNFSFSFHNSAYSGSIDKLTKSETNSVEYSPGSNVGTCYLGAKDAQRDSLQPITDDSSACLGSQNGEHSEVCSCSSNRGKGIGFAMLSTITSSFNNITVSMLSGNVGPHEATFMQMLHILLFAIPLATLFKASFRLSRKAFLVVLYRCIIGSICTMLAYFAFQEMSVGNATALIYTSPVFTGIFSFIILREACPFIDVILSVFIFGGILLVIQPPFIFGEVETTTSIWGPIACLLCALFLGTIYVALKQIHSHRVHPMTILTIYGIVGMISSSIVTSALKEWVIPRCGKDRVLLILIGVLAFLVHLFTTLATLYEKATTVSIIKTTDVLFTFLLEYLFFGNIPNYITIIGAVLIVSCLIAITLRKWWSEKKRMEKDLDMPKEAEHK